MWYQCIIILSEKLCGFYLIIDEIIDKLFGLLFVEMGLLYLLLLYILVLLMLNENCDFIVCVDMECYFLKIVFDNVVYEYDYEGVDDMFLYIKLLVLGVLLLLFVCQGCLQLGIW